MTRARVLADFVGGTTTISGTPTFTGTVTGAGGGKVLKASISEIATQNTRANANSFANDLDFGSFTPSTSSSTVLIYGVAYMDTDYQYYLDYKWVIDGTDYTTGNGDSTMRVYNGVTNNSLGYIPCPIMTSVSNTDGSAITVVCQGRTSNSTTSVYVNRAQTDTNSGGKSSVIFIEVAS